jgi:hypothetical protein
MRRLCGFSAALALSACGGSDAPLSSSPTPTPSATPATPTPVASQPAATPASTPAPAAGSMSSVPTPIASNFDVNSGLVASWGNGAIPDTAAPDVVGAFRFTCRPSHEASDDPLVYPGQPGKSHLHEFFGNTAVNANTTYTTLRTTGESTCGNKVNRSGYWQPAMVSASGTVLKPDEWAIYYKRAPAGSPECLRRATSCVPIPTGIRFIYGYDMLTGTPSTGSLFWKCVSTNADSPTMAGALANCPNGSQLEARIEAPDCWDGVNVDSPNHRSHVAYGNYDIGFYKCPSTHPVNIPQFTLGSLWAVTDALRTASLSSDMGMPQGSSFHADYFEGWDPGVKAMWEANCINKLLNCSGGDLGYGLQIMGAQ